MSAHYLYNTTADLYVFALGHFGASLPNEFDCALDDARADLYSRVYV